MAPGNVVGRWEYKLTGTFSYLFKVTQVESRHQKCFLAVENPWGFGDSDMVGKISEGI